MMKTGKILYHNRLKFVVCLTLFFFLCLLCTGTQSVLGDTSKVQSYAPVLYFEAQEECYPINAEFHIDNSHLYIHDGESPTLITENPNASDLAQISQNNFYLDNKHGLVRDSTSLISSYQQQKNQYDKVVYYREDTYAGKHFIQYWFFYAYNNGDLNVHEGDWEMIQIIFNSDTPTNVMYSQHHSGQQASWTDVETTNSHPHVYVAKGSHANYFRYFSGKLGVAGDTVGNNGIILTSEDYILVDLSDQDWLSFAGRWGETKDIEDTFLGFGGPFGPSFRENGEMWNNPTGWGSNLPQLNTSLFPVELFLYHFITIFILITLVSIGLLLFRLYRRYKKQGLGPRIFSLLYIDGLNKHSLGNLLFFIGLAIALVGLFLPWYGMSAQITVGEYNTEGFVDFLQIDGLKGVQITYPGANGPIAVGSFILPFAILIGIGIIFTLFKTVGIHEGRRLGRIYIWRGVALTLPFIILIVVIFSLGSIIPSMIPNDSGGKEILGLFSSLSQSPFGGSESIPITEMGVTGSVNLIWGLGSGGFLLITAGIIVICSGILLVRSKKTFY